MKLGDGAGLAPGTTLASNRGGWRWTAASLMGDLRTENDPILNITGRAPVPASIRVAADTGAKIRCCWRLGPECLAEAPVTLNERDEGLRSSGPAYSGLGCTQ